MFCCCCSEKYLRETNRVNQMDSVLEVSTHCHLAPLLWAIAGVCRTESLASRRGPHSALLGLTSNAPKGCLTVRNSTALNSTMLEQAFIRQTLGVTLKIQMMVVLLVFKDRKKKQQQRHKTTRVFFWWDIRQPRSNNKAKRKRAHTSYQWCLLQQETVSREPQITRK